MKKNKIFILIIAIAGIMTSCGEKYLTIYPSGDVVAGAPATSDVIDKNVTGAYQLMLFDDYANGQWMPVDMFFDVCTDDIFKGGGDASDQAFILGVSEFRSTPTLGATGWWSIFYAGLKRCNGALDAIDKAVDPADPTLPRLKAEMLTLRAYYVQWLWKAYGNIPYFDKAWTAEPFLAKQYSFDELYPLIIADLDAAIATPEFQLAIDKVKQPAMIGRVTKAMAMMTKARVVMYKKDQSKYAEVLADMKTIINNGAFGLVTTAAQPNFTGTGAPATTNPFEWIFLRNGEFCKESIFEVNHYPEGKDWTPWHGYGNYTPRFIGPRNDVAIPAIYDAGWGFCPVNPATYKALFNEAGDYRKDASVIKFPLVNGKGEPVTQYQNPEGLYLKKYIARKGYNEGTSGDPNLIYENNKRIFRIAEAYLNAAELTLATNGGQGAAQPYLDAIRDRAFGDTNHRIPATLNNIKLERHREFFGEGMRFWDLVRWGSDEKDRSIKDVLSITDMDIPISRVWDDNKKFLPIPQGEIDKTQGTEFELVQNPGYN